MTDAVTPTPNAVALAAPPRATTALALRTEARVTGVPGDSHPLVRRMPDGTLRAPVAVSKALMQRFKGTRRDSETWRSARLSATATVGLAPVLAAGMAAGSVFGLWGTMLATAAASFALLGVVRWVDQTFPRASDAWRLRVRPTATLGRWHIEVERTDGAPCEAHNVYITLVHPGRGLPALDTWGGPLDPVAPGLFAGESTLPPPVRAEPPDEKALARRTDPPFWAVLVHAHVRGRPRTPSWEMHDLLAGPIAAYHAHVRAAGDVTPTPEIPGCVACGMPTTAGACTACGARALPAPDAEAWLSRALDVPHRALADALPTGDAGLDVDCAFCAGRTVRSIAAGYHVALCPGCGGLHLPGETMRQLEQAGCAPR